MKKRKEHSAALQFNNEAFKYAKMLIHEGKVNCEQHVWSEDKPSAESQDAYLADHTFNQYGKWFLATKDDSSSETKEHFEFPVGNFDEVFRAGVIAAKQRAAQFHHKEIEAAAAELLDMIDKGVCKA